MRRCLSLLLLVVIGIGGVGVSDRAEACGPDFPPSLLWQREAALTAPLDEPFFQTAATLADDLAPKDPPFVVVTWQEPDGARDHGGAEERRLYDDGARLYNAGDHEGAAVAFRTLLQLPDDQRRHRSTWAAFMLGRLGDTARFEEVRSLAAAGFVDELGLAHGSLGEEARTYLSSGGNPTVGVAADDARALLLYARQARLDVTGTGGVSLLQLARDIIETGGPRLDAVAATPIGQRLLVTYAATRADERPLTTNAALTVLVGHADCAWPDQLAAALYKQGRIDEATQFVAKAPSTPLGLWVRARLAMRAGHLDEANTLLAQASAAFPVQTPPKGLDEYEDGWASWNYEGSEQVHGHRRLVGEQGVLALSRREYVFALERFLEEDAWWRDAAHVAERVLSLDELKQFVLSHPQWATAPAKRKAYRPDLRGLLARRLVREGRVDEALTFFDDPKIAVHARRLAALRNDTATDLAALPDEIRKAARLYAEAQVLRTAGLEVLGTELAPDWAIFGGSFEPWEEGTTWDDDGNRIAPPPKKDPLESDDEARRIKASAPQPMVRYHYRAKAAVVAEEAASLVPPRSQAYAAILCKASGYIVSNPAEVQRLWQLYVKNGAMVDFAGAFGSTMQTCPDPDFGKLVAQAKLLREARLRKVGTAVAVSLIVVAIAVIGVRRRRRR